MFLASAVLVTASAAQQEAADRRRMVDDVDAMLASAAGKLGVAKLGRLTSRDPHCKAGKLERRVARSQARCLPRTLCCTRDPGLMAGSATGGTRAGARMVIARC